MSAEKLDELLGDAWDAGNPVGYAAVLAADERREMPTAGERLLDGYGLNAEFVPLVYGGRLTRADDLAEILRTVWRRDPCLGLGYGLGSFSASVNIWNSGDEPQRRTAAGLLLGNQRIAAGFQRLDHGDDFSLAESAARPTGGGWLLSGREEIGIGIRRADAMVLLARTGADAHSQFVVARHDFPVERVRDVPPSRTSGMRGVRFGGVEFADCPVLAGALLGSLGQGRAVALRSYRITGGVTAAVSLGPLDTALRAVLANAFERRLYGGAVADIPYVRAVIARAYADLLAVDALASVAARALHLVPDAMAVYAPAAEYVASRIVLDAFEQLRSALGAQAFLRQGPYAIFQKMARDIGSVLRGSRAACLAMISSRLPRLARESWLIDPAAPRQLFDLGASLPTLDLSRQAASDTSDDGVIGALAQIAELAPDDVLTGRFAARFLGELRALREECATLPDMAADRTPVAHALAHRYAVLLAAASALAVWRRGDARHSAGALLGVLDRLSRRLGGAAVLTATERDDVEECLYEEAAQRYHDRRLFDLTARRIPG